MGFFDSVLKIVTAVALCISVHVHKTAVRAEFKCPDGWMVQGSHCFLVSSTRNSTWHQAVHTCATMNSSLVKITNKDESDFLGRKLSTDGWIGIHDDIGDESFTWLDEGKALNFTYWKTGEPNNAAENCVSMYGYTTNKGRWNDHFCRNPRKYICEKNAVTTGCPDKWRVFAGHCYYFSNDSLTWYDARIKCQNMSGDLVIIENSLENNFIKGAIRTNYWLGLNDRKGEGNFKWNDNSEVPTFYLWNFGEPNNGNNALADCVTMYPQSYRRGKWAASICTSNYGYVCEKQRTGQECDNSWVSPGNLVPNSTSCYLSVRDMTDWNSARKACQDGGGDLLAIESSEEQNYIKNRISIQSWIGLNDNTKTGQWSWLDSSEVVFYSRSGGSTTDKFTNWYRNEPANKKVKDADCVLLHTGAHNIGQWANINCDLNTGYVCEHTSGSCVAPWKEFNGHCYSFNADAASWNDAIQRCKLQQTSANLAVIENEGVQNFLNDNIKNLTRLPGLWSGLNSKVKRGEFRWLNRSDPLTYTNWAARSPSLFLQEACVSITASGYQRIGQWSDNDCMTKKGYVCQIPAEGDSSYYDFKLNQSIYKIVRQKFSQEEGQKFCTEIMGNNTTLLHFDDEEEYNEINSELTLRFSSYQTQFWIDWNPDSNDTYIVLADQPGPVRQRDFSEPADLTRKCMMMSPRSTRVPFRPYHGSRPAYNYMFKMYRRSCCEEKMLICEKHIETGTKLGYDFEFNDSVYKVIIARTAKPDVAHTACRTMGAFFGSGHLVEIDSEAELIAISTELKVRHLGSQFQYWVGGDPQGNLTYDNLLRDPQPDEKCIVLTHEGFPDVPWTKRSLDLMPTSCDATEKFICELNLYVGAPLYSPSQQLQTPPNDKDTDEPKVLVNSPGCVGPCIGLAVAFPLGIILAVLITSGIFIYCKRRDNFGFSFHKASDEVYLTA